MKPSLQKLQKFFKLEAERGYDDRAVVGGLERIINTWENDARVDNLPEELIQAVIARLRDYNRLSPTSRQEALQGLWQRTQRKLADEDDLVPEKEIGGDADLVVERSLPPEQDSKLVSPPPTVTQTKPDERQAGKDVASSDQQIQPAALNSPVTVLQGVGVRHGETLKRLGMATLGDMLNYYPRRYDDYSKLKPINRLVYGEEVTVIGTIQNVAKRSLRNKRATITEAILSDGTASLRLTWFNQPWIEQRLRTGIQMVISGKIDQYLGRIVMNNPEMEPLSNKTFIPTGLSQFIHLLLR
jgi:ATP-dependent DNA helicase RecG